MIMFNRAKKPEYLTLGRDSVRTESPHRCGGRGGGQDALPLIDDIAG